MPNNSSDNFDAHAFTALLHFLDPEDPDEANNKYLRLQRKLVGYFNLKGMFDPITDAEDALQRAGKKILEGVPIPDIDRFCMGIARNIVMERLRNRRREESAFIRFMEISNDENTKTDRITELMKQCFEKLLPADRDLLISYCKVSPGKSRAEHRRQLAEDRGWSIEALRTRVTRLRRVLTDCVKELSKDL